MLPAEYASEFWAQDLTNIHATPTAGGLVLTAQEGYMLPEYIAVKIGQMTFYVKTDGTEAPEGIFFDSTTGLLLIAESLMAENPGGVMVSAAAVPKMVPDAETPAGDGGSADTGQSAGGSEPAGSSETVGDSETTGNSELTGGGETTGINEPVSSGETAGGNEPVSSGETTGISEPAGNSETTGISEPAGGGTSPVDGSSQADPANIRAEN